jgi:hypothetical protein
MKKEVKFLALVLLGLFTVSLVAGVVSAAWTDSARSFFEPFLGQLAAFESSFLVQVLLFFLVFLIVYAISGEVPFVSKKNWMKLPLSLIVSALATFFLKSSEIAIILANYKALGIAVTIVLPFVLITIISKGLNTEGHYFASKFLWIVFIAVTLTRIIGAAHNGEVSGEALIVIGLVLLAAVLMFFFEKKIFFLGFKEKIKGAQEEIKKSKLAGVTSELDELADKIKHTKDDDQKKALIREFNRRASFQRDLGGTYEDWKG